MKFSLLFLSLLFNSISYADELELIFYRAPSPLNWSSPGNLVRSMTQNLQAQVDGETYPHPISHVNLRLQCGSQPAIYRGMTSVKSNAAYLWDFVIQGSSLDTLLINQKGRSYSKEEILYWLPRLRSRGYVRSLRILLNPGQCARASAYLQLYKKTGLHNIYGGLRSDPQHGEGAGCSAFAVSVLQVLNLFPRTVAQEWQRELRIPLNLLSSQEQRARISFLGYLRGKDRPWAQPDEKHIHLKFWDPERMFRWAGNKGKIWDAREGRIPQTPLFPWDQKTLIQTVRYHFENRRRLLSREEISDTSSRYCRNFQPCR